VLTASALRHDDQMAAEFLVAYCCETDVDSGARSGERWPRSRGFSDELHPFHARSFRV